MKISPATKTTSENGMEQPSEQLLSPSYTHKVGGPRPVQTR